MKLQYIRTDRNGTKIYYDRTCPRCGGAGQSDKWKMTGRTCYECGGSGKRPKPKIVKEYTPEHQAKLDEAARKRYFKKCEEKNAVFFERHGFAKDGTAYIFIGDTYPIKDYLKAEGAKYQFILGWIAPYPISDYPCVKINASEVVNFTEWYDFDIDKCRDLKQKLSKRP